MGSIRVPRALLDEVVAHARAAAPEEACGALVGTKAGNDIVVERAVPMRNAHPDPRAAYLIEPAHLLQVVLRAEDEWGLEVVGFYHSHPAGPSRLSRMDVELASWEGGAYLLVWLAPSAGIGCWRWDGAAFAELTVQIG